MEYAFKVQNSIRAKVRRAQRQYLALDYDGTLTRIVSDPERAFLPKRTRELLRKLAANTRCVLVIASGRRLKDLIRLVDVDRAYYVGNYGLELKGPGVRFVHSGAKKFSRHVRKLSRQLNQGLLGTGAFVENKHLTISVHYRKARQSIVPRILATIKLVLQDYDLFEVNYGKKVVDIKPKVSWNKENALEMLMKRLGRHPLLYIGDDRADEEAFVKLRSALTVRVTRRPKASIAQYYLKSPGEVATFLKLFNSWLQEPYRA